MSGVQVVLVVLVLVVAVESVVLAVVMVRLCGSMKRLRISSRLLMNETAELQTMIGAPARRGEAMSRSRSDSGRRL